VLSVFLVDDHEIVRRGLIDLLDSDPDLRVIGEAGDVANAMAGIRATRPDVAVLDVRLPDGNGIELCRDLLAELDGLHCLILTSYTDEHAMLDAILAGASGYVVKDIKGMELAEAIKAVGAGRSLLDNRAGDRLHSRTSHASYVGGGQSCAGRHGDLREDSRHRRRSLNREELHRCTSVLVLVGRPRASSWCGLPARSRQAPREKVRFAGYAPRQDAGNRITEPVSKMSAARHRRPLRH